MKRQSQRATEARPQTSRLLRNEPILVGAHADYRREDFVFARTQSQQMRALEWDSRLKPIRPWGSNFVANLAFEIFA